MCFCMLLEATLFYLELPYVCRALFAPVPRHLNLSLRLVVNLWYYLANSQDHEAGSRRHRAADPWGVASLFFPARRTL